MRRTPRARTCRGTQTPARTTDPARPPRSDRKLHAPGADPLDEAPDRGTVAFETVLRADEHKRCGGLSIFLVEREHLDDVFEPLVRSDPADREDHRTTGAAGLTPLVSADIEKKRHHFYRAESASTRSAALNDESATNVLNRPSSLGSAWRAWSQRAATPGLKGRRRSPGVTLWYQSTRGPEPVTRPRSYETRSCSEG